MTSLQTLFGELCSNAGVPVHCIAHLIQTCLYQLQSVASDEIDTFLEKDLDKLEWLGDYAKKHFVSKELLLSISSGQFNNIPTMAFISNGLLNEMNIFRNRKQFHTAILLSWLRALCPDFELMKTEQLNKLLRKVSSEIKRRQRRSGDAGGACQLQEYKDCSCLLSEAETGTLSTSAPTPTSSAPTPTSTPTSTAPTPTPTAPTPSPSAPTSSAPTPCPSAPTSSASTAPTLSAATSSAAIPSAVTDMSSQAPCSIHETDNCVFDKLSAVISEQVSAVLSDQMSTVLSDQIHIDSVRNELAALKEIICEKNDTILSLQRKDVKQKEHNNNLQAKLETSRNCELASKAKLCETRRLCAELKHSNLYRRHERLQTKYQDARTRLGVLQNLSVQLQIQDEKEKKRQYQKYASRVERKRKQMIRDLQSANDTIFTLLNEIERNNAPTAVPETRTETGFFQDFVVKCTYELIGECQVPASRCREVVQVVSKHFFGVTFPIEALPGKTTSLRFADQSHSLSKIQVAEAISENRYDIHTDGTSKKNKKFVGFQVTLENKQTLCLGFDPVANQTAQTVLDLALNKLDEFAFLTAKEDTEAEKKKMLQNLVGLMSDRASTMKCVGKLLQQHITTTLQQEVQVEFLHCNAHFLLGISTGAEKALLRVAKENGLDGRLGRENIPAFQHFNARACESAVCRFVRMTCDTLGPRPDEKNGCHADWMAYCASQQKSSQLTSFRANRFNNLFQAAAGIIHHRKDILEFFDLRVATNLKQKSVLADAECSSLTTMLLGLALMFVYFTGPFWIFVRSDVHYLDQRTFIQPMHIFLKDMCQHPEMLLQVEEVPHELESFRMRNLLSVDTVLLMRNTISPDDRCLLGKVMKSLAQEFVQVIERQLSDFLPDGKYGMPPSDQDRQRMAHCQLTNLIGEACFADMDYSMFKNRGASLHHHSTLNMTKRNKTVSGWLECKTEVEQADLMDRARKLGPQMRKADRQQELIVLQELRNAMERKKREGQEEQARREEKLRKQKEAILQCVTSQGGPCQSADDIIRLLQEQQTKAAKMKALKAQIDYEKVIIGSSSPKLKTTKVAISDQAKNLISFKFDQDTADAFATAVVAACVTRRKRKRPVVSSSSDSDTDVPPDEVNQPLPTEGPNFEEEEDFTFAFTHQGQTVAVFYNREFYIGQVLNVINPDLADVTFMTSKGLENIFKWPGGEDIDQVAAKFVFDYDFDITLRNRTWNVEDSNRWNRLLARWTAYQNLFGQ